LNFKKQTTSSGFKKMKKHTGSDEKKVLAYPKK
jgi:hypothetical protein